VQCLLEVLLKAPEAELPALLQGFTWQYDKVQARRRVAEPKRARI
jgi:hypothetical protein